ncbi:MAG: hypothetical protein A2W00_03920 [Candidatus Eisenbacteria bacterium RBG_16_71_46]|nr:MAG: hypothetical protein A2W00_03920 [Candidatus Eisenbacteria bacterium RBG_16_71_46]OGF23152.1 MAG: hypothetical protein A2V63_05335 [Candidatus Eisenbacteria bacterium RBG_19FT_COMBO_70_11]
MVRAFALVFLVAGLLAGRDAIGAPPGSYLAWDSCVGEGGTRTRDFACNGTTGSDVLVASFVLSQPMEQFIALSAEIEICTTAPYYSDRVCTGLPDWWRLEPGGCRAGSVALSTDLSGPPWSDAVRCASPWIGAHTDDMRYVGNSRVAFVQAIGSRSEPTALVAGTE